MAEQKNEATERAKGKKPGPVKDKKAAIANGPRLVAQKHKASELGDVWLGHELVKPSKKSQKFTLGSSYRDSGATDEEGVCRDFYAPFCVVDCFLLLIRINLSITVCCIFIFPYRIFIFAFGFLGYHDVWLDGYEKVDHCDLCHL